MLYKRILVPFDGSEPAKNALSVAKKLIADDPEATMYIVTIVSTGAMAVEFQTPAKPGSGTPMLFPGADSYKKAIDSVLNLAKERQAEGIGHSLDDVRCKVVTDTMISAKVQDGIVDYAKAHGCEIIVMGRRGLGSLRGMLGSVSYGVLHQSDVPVLTVK